MTDKGKLEGLCETPMSDHVARFWNILETERYVRLVIDMQRPTERGHYWDSSLFGDDCAKTLVVDRQRMSAENARLREALEKTLGHLLNAQIDIETGTKKETTLATIKGGVLIARAALTQSQE